MSGKGVRPKTPRVEVHSPNVDEWRAHAESRGQALATWLKEAADETMERQKKRKTKK